MNDSETPPFEVHDREVLAKARSIIGETESPRMWAQAVIDAVKFDRDVAGLPEKEATVIRLARALFRDHKVSPELWGKTVEFFGRQGAVEIVATMGDYVMAGFMLTAVDQQLPPDRKPLLPPRR